MRIELIHDEPSFFREIRIGHWRHVYDYETKQGEWYWEKEGADEWPAKIHMMKQDLFRPKRKPRSSKKSSAA